ncbi:caspase family protein [Streptomyces sp. NBC_01390]|uniref:caspase, EACC1-associated type n=1 Tax=Streptomyces sp. NBC_01390 TaxID=2903850 RepID=UPI00324E0856
MGRRLALLIATYSYQDAGLRRLTAPAHDAEAFAAVLRDPDIAGFEVTVLINQPHHVVGEAIGDFYRDRRRDDLTLLYFTGHGLKDDGGRLYLAMTNTRRDSLLFTALSAEHIDQAMESCVSRQKVLILDCCYSGAFPAGRISKGDPEVHALERFQGRGRTVLTASDATQYSFEGDQTHGHASQSVFTRHLVAGLRDGSADLDGDGDITLDELYGYAHDRVVDEMPQQRPKKLDSVEGRIIIARNINWTIPAHLRNSIGSPIAAERLAALDGLTHLHRIGNDVVRGCVIEEIRQLAEDDSRLVSTAAAAHLRSLSPQALEPPPEPPPEPLPTPASAPAAPSAAPEAVAQGPAAFLPEPPAAPSSASSDRTCPMPDEALAAPPSPHPGTAAPGPARRSRLFPRTRRAKALTVGVTALALAAAVVGALLTSRGTGNEGHCPRTIPSPYVLRDAGSYVAFSPDGTTLATFTVSSDDTSVRLWDLPTHKTTATIQRRTLLNNGEAFSPDGRFLVTQDQYVAVQLRNTSTGETTTINTGQKDVVSAAVSPDGKTVAIARASHPDEAYPNPVGLWDTESGKRTATLPGHTNGVGYMAFSPDGETLATGSNDKSVRLWDVRTAKSTATITDAYGGMFSPDGKTFAVMKGDGPVRLWDVRTRKATTTLANTPYGWFSRDGKTFVGVSGASTLRLWDVNSGKSVAVFDPGGQLMGFSPSSDAFAIETKDKTVQLWDLATRKPVTTITGVSPKDRRPAFSPDGKIFAGAGADGTVRLWDIAGCP